MPRVIYSWDHLNYGLPDPRIWGPSPCDTQSALPKVTEDLLSFGLLTIQ